MKKFLLIPLCVSVIASAVSANAQTQDTMPQSEMHGKDLSGTYSQVWNSKIEDQMSSDTYYWKSKGNIEAAKSKALDLEAKNIAKQRNIAILKNKKSDSSKVVSNTVDDFLGGSILSQQVDKFDSANQEKYLPESSVATQKKKSQVDELKRQQEQFMKEMTDFVNKKLAKDETTKPSIAPSDNGGANVAQSSEVQPANPKAEKTDKFKFDKKEALAPKSVISARIMDVRKGRTKVMFAISNPNQVRIGGDETLPTFMTADVFATSKEIPVTVNFGETYNVKVDSFTPTKIVFEYNGKTFTASI